MSRSDKFLLLCTSLLALVIFVSIHSKADEEKIEFALGSDHITVPPGGTADVKIQIRLAEGWHTYGLKPKVDEYGLGPQATEVTIDDSVRFSLIDVREPKPKQKYDDAFMIDVDYHVGTLGLDVALQVDPATPAGDYDANLLVYYQICDSTRCLPPEEIKLPLRISVSGEIAEDAENSVTDGGTTSQSAGITDGSQFVKLELKQPGVDVQAGGEAEIQVTMTIAKDWHAYGLVRTVDEYGLGPEPTQFVLKDSSIARLGSIRETAPLLKYDSAFLMNTQLHYDEATFTLPILVHQDIEPGSYTLELEVGYQICKEASCLPPEFKTMQVQLNVEKAHSSLWALFLVALGAGGFALLTPCVFPMIPITVSFFTKRAEKNPGQGIRDALIYSLGIILTFSGIGVLLTIVFGPTGVSDLATNAWVNLIIAAIFIIFAFNLFGAFEIQLPTSILNKLNKASSDGKGVGAIMLMALTFSLTSFTCTVPFVGSAFFAVAQGEWFRPILGMFGFSLVFATPFFFLALFPSLMQKLPRAGGWMNNIKVVMGFLEIAAAYKFLSNADLVWSWQILPRDLFLAVWVGCSVLITLYVLGVYRFAHDAPVEHVGTVRVMFALFFATVTFYLVGGLFGRPLGELDAFLPPPDSIYYMEEAVSDAAGSTSSERAITGVAASRAAGKAHAGADDHGDWLRNYEEGLALAKEQGKPLFIDFTGYTCTNCRWMELNRFPLPEIKKRMDQMVKVQLFTDRRNEECLANKQLQIDRFGDIALPLYVILTPDEQEIGRSSFTRSKPEFIRFLDKAL